MLSAISGFTVRGSKPDLNNWGELFRVMSKQLFTIKGSRQGLTIICDDKAVWADVLDSLNRRLQGKERDFLEGASVTIDLGSRTLRRQEAADLWGFCEDNKIVIKELRTGRSPEPERNNGAAREDMDSLPTLVVERSLRSGQNLAYNGNDPDR